MKVIVIGRDASRGPADLDEPTRVHVEHEEREFHLHLTTHSDGLLGSGGREFGPSIPCNGSCWGLSKEEIELPQEMADRLRALLNARPS